MPESVKILSRNEKTTAAIKVPAKLPFPPVKRVPPKTAMVNAESSYPLPMVGVILLVQLPNIGPARAAHNPPNVNIKIFILSALMPEVIAAFSFAPT